MNAGVTEDALMIQKWFIQVNIGTSRVRVQKWLAGCFVGKVLLPVGYFASREDGRKEAGILYGCFCFFVA